MRRALDSGKFSEKELLESQRCQIEKWQPKINAYSEIFEEPLRQTCSKGPLSGIPISIKDSLDIAGHATVCGHPPRRAHRAGQHALCVQRLLNAGATILGKTNTPEMLMNWETHNDVFGATRNPWRLSHTPGGSSGGESAAIAACMSAGGIGSDGGGSIRLPAALTGICGLKPTPGRVPASGHFPNVGYPGGLLGVIGPMARSVADVRMLFEVVAGHDDGDPFSVPFTSLPVEKKPRVGIVEHPTTRHAAALLGGCDEFPAQVLIGPCPSGLTPLVGELFDGLGPGGVHRLEHPYVLPDELLLRCLAQGREPCEIAVQHRIARLGRHREQAKDTEGVAHPGQFVPRASGSSCWLDQERLPILVANDGAANGAGGAQNVTRTTREIRCLKSCVWRDAHLETSDV